jgi:hypothetical protein
MAKEVLPKEILVYMSDCVGGEPVYDVARNANEIPEDQDGVRVGVYSLSRTVKFKVKTMVTRELLV